MRLSCAFALASLLLPCVCTLRGTTYSLPPNIVIGVLDDTHQIFGQTFVAPEPTLASWSFLFSSGTGSELDFTFSIAEWNGLQLVGPTLFESLVQTIPAGIQSYTVETNLSLTVDKTYAAFINTSGLNSSYFWSIYGRSGGTDPLHGQLILFNDGQDPNALRTNAWRLTNLDATYTAVFAGRPSLQVSEGGTPLILLGVAASVLLYFRRRL